MISQWPSLSSYIGQLFSEITGILLETSGYEGYSCIPGAHCSDFMTHTFSMLLLQCKVRPSIQLEDYLRLKNSPLRTRVAWFFYHSTEIAGSGLFSIQSRPLKFSLQPNLDMKGTSCCIAKRVWVHACLKFAWLSRHSWQALWVKNFEKYSIHNPVTISVGLFPEIPFSDEPFFFV